MIKMFAKNKKDRSYGVISVISKIGAPILGAVYYISIVCVLLCAVIALIMLLVNTSVDDMLLPPFMSVHGNEYYSIAIGNGIRINAAYDTVSLGDIKTVIYAQLLLSAAFFCMLAPIARFLSRLMKNIKDGAELNPQNANYMRYTGLSVMIGHIFVELAGEYYNFLLVKTFVTDKDAIHLSLGFDFYGILIGVLILFFANVYGRVCVKNTSEEGTNVTKELTEL